MLVTDSPVNGRRPATSMISALTSSKGGGGEGSRESWRKNSVGGVDGGGGLADTGDDGNGEARSERKSNRIVHYIFFKNSWAFIMFEKVGNSHWWYLHVRAKCC